MKLVVTERESLALKRYLGAGASLVTASIGRVEVLRHALRRDPASFSYAEYVVEEVTLVEITRDILNRASRLDPPTLRTLDAIHIASALTLGDELDAIVTYDVRMQEAAAALGIPVAAPS